ncbi:unnamed protein product [Malus baccata var. baccata]
MKIAQKMPWLSVFSVIGFFALLPLPQLLIGVIFYTMKGSGLVEHKDVLNFFLLCQYFPRIYRIYLSAEDFKMINGMWIKGLYNMFLYILSSHLTCWQEACVNHSKDPRACLNTFNCDSRSSTARNITFINEYCPLDTPNGASSPFNFGIFIDSLQNQNTEHIPFRKKFFYSFWWGLRNLSNCLICGVTDFYADGSYKKRGDETKDEDEEVKMIQGMDDKVLTLMCDYLKPVTYIENSNIFRMGDPLDCVLIIMEGTVWTYASSDSQAGRGISSMGTKPLRKGDFYGEELFDWAPGSFTELPVSSKHVKTRIKVDAFLLTANDLDSVVSKHRLQWKKEGTLTPAMKIMAASTIATAFRSGRRLRAITKGEKNEKKGSQEVKIMAA